MAYVIEVPNPFEPSKGLVKHLVTEPLSIREWLLRKDPNFVEFPVATLCLYNGTPVKRAEWDLIRFKQPTDVVTFVSIPNGPFLLVAILVVALIALSVAITTNVNIPKTPGELPASDPVFSNKGQENTIRLGEPVEVNYGRNRIYPSLASRPFYKYVNNDQFQYTLFCIGQGEYDIATIQIGDTDINSFQEVQYEIIPPGADVTLFPTNVITSIEAGGQTLFAPNEPEYVAPGWVGPFVTNPSLTQTDKIEVDIIYPKGLYTVDSKGNVQSLSITIEIEAQQIDDAGAPIGGFFALTIPFPITLTAATTTPQRRTYSGTVALGRYQVRVRRTDTKDLSPRSGHDALWEGLRSFVNTSQDFGNKTLLAVKIRATNNLNDRTQNRFNVIATRKLEVMDPTGRIFTLSATRSIVWAFVDVFRSAYGGRVADTFLDFDELLDLDDVYEGRNEHFDWIFRDPITVWEAAQAIAQVGRGVPLIKGSLITLKRDEPQSIPVAMFSPDNILKSTFNKQVKFWDTDENDSIRIEYTEPATGYKQETVVCTLPGGTTDNPKDVRLPGCQERNHAYRTGLFMMASLRYLRENITFDTGLEGHIPTYGDLIAIAYDATEWGQSGYIVNADQDTGGAAILWLSEPLNWTGDTGSHVMMLRGRQGQPMGPYSVTRMEDDQQVLLELPTDIDFQLDGTTEPMLFIFGVLGNITKYAKIVNLEPQGGEGVRCTTVNYSPIIYSFDELIAHALSQPTLAPQAPDLPEIGHLYITQIDDVLHIVQIAWTPAFGAQTYVVQTSEDGSNWQERAVTAQTSIQVQVRPGTLYVRVSALNNGQGPWIQDTFAVGIMGALDLYDAWDNDLEFAVRWWQVLNAISWEAKVYDDSGISPVLIRTEEIALDTRSYQYDYTKAIADGHVVRSYKVTIDAIFEEGASGAPSEVIVTNAIPAAPVITGATFNYVDPVTHSRHYILAWLLPADADLHHIKVWLSPVHGFDPSVTSPYFEEEGSGIGYIHLPTSIDVGIAIDSTGGHPDYYVRVAIFDVWGNELTTNLSGESLIPAH
jgi:hypothetical protein